MSRKSFTSACSQDERASRRVPYTGILDQVDVYGNRQWHSAFKKARHVVLEEPTLTLEGEPINFKPIQGVERAYDFLCERYIQYVVLLKILDESMQRLLHPQKRLLFKKFIEGIAFRVCELKNEMSSLVCLNNHNMVPALLDLGLTPDDLEYSIPPCLLSNQRTTVQNREQLLTCMLNTVETRPDCILVELIDSAASSKSVSVSSTAHSSKLGVQQPPANRTPSPNLTVGDPDSTIVRMYSNSKTNEAGSGRLRDVRKSVSKLNDKSVKQEPTSNSGSNTNLSVEMVNFLTSRRYKEWLVDPAFHPKVTLLQRNWRKWADRKVATMAADSIAVTYDMVLTDNKAETSKDQAAQPKFQALCKDWDDEHTAKEEQLRKEHPESSEANFDKWEFKLNLRQWVLELRDFLGKMPPYPDPELGGCSALFTNKTVAEVEDELDDLDENEKKKAPAKEDKKKAEEKGKGGKEKDEGFIWNMPRTSAVPCLIHAFREYGSYWSFKNEWGNIDQRYELQLVKEKVRAEAEQTIRELVDAMMIQELELLRAVDGEGKPKPEKKKEKKEKGKKGKKDPLEGRTEEELYAELVLHGVVTKPMQASLSDVVGSPNMADTTRSPYHIPSVPELRMVLREVYGLPLSSTVIHSAMELRNSLLLAGPAGTGKTTMIHALAKETGSTLIDLSPVNMVGKFQGKKQEDYLLNVLLKICKAYEPSILLVDECHLLFPTKKARKRPDVDKDKPARWGKMLTKFMKKLKPGDRILLAGLTNEPFFAKTGPMCRLFQNVYHVPLPDYGNRVVLWQNFLDNLKLKKPHLLNVSVLAKLSEGYSGEDIHQCVDECLTKERRELNRLPRNQELIPALAKHHPEEEAPDREAWLTWFESTPVVQARIKLLESIAAEEEAAAGKK